MEIDKELKNQLKKQRLKELQATTFNHQMTIESLRVNGDEEGVKEFEKRIKALEIAYQAIEKM